MLQRIKELVRQRVQWVLVLVSAWTRGHHDKGGQMQSRVNLTVHVILAGVRDVLVQVATATNIVRFQPFVPV